MEYDECGEVSTKSARKCGDKAPRVSIIRSEVIHLSSVFIPSSNANPTLQKPFCNRPRNPTPAKTTGAADRNAEKSLGIFNIRNNNHMPTTSCLSPIASLAFGDSINNLNITTFPSTITSHSKRENSLYESGKLIKNFFETLFPPRKQRRMYLPHRIRLDAWRFGTAAMEPRIMKVLGKPVVVKRGRALVKIIAIIVLLNDVCRCPKRRSWYRYGALCGVCRLEKLFGHCHVIVLPPSVGRAGTP